VRSRLLALRTREFGVAEGAALLLVAYLGSAILGAARQILLSVRFGAGEELSAYLAAAKLPDTLFVLVAGGALTNAMVPVLIATRRSDARAVPRLIELTLTALLVTVTLLTLAALVLAPWLVRTVLAPGFDDSTAELTTNLTRLMLAQPLLLALTSLAVATLNAQARFFLPALAILVQNIAEIAGIGLSWLIPSIHVYGPALGLIGGVALQAIVLLPALRRHGRWPHLRWDPGDTRLRQIIALLIPNALLVGSTYLGGVAEVAFASLTREANAIPALTNAWLLVGLPVRLIGTAAGQAAFPRMAADVARHEWTAFWQRIWQVALIVGIITLLGIPVFLLLGRSLVALLLEHGAYTRQDGDLTYTLAIAFAWGLPFHALTEIVTRGLLALRDTRTPLLTNLLQLALRMGAMWLLIDQWGLTVIPWSLTITAAGECLLLWLLLHRRIRAARREVV
jgi:putative peptidoglycan lipid II flippase